MSFAPYPGETPQKTRVRQELYSRTANLWNTGTRPGGHAVVVAGPQACEIPHLRDQLKLDPKKVLFVDKAIKGIHKVRRVWPEARVYHGMLHDALDTVPTIGFLNIDLMGFFNKNVVKATQSAAHKLLPGAIVSFTFFRSRERVDQHHSFFRLHAAAGKHLKTRSFSKIDTVRWVGYTELLQSHLGNPPLHPIGMWHYESVQRSMGVIALQNMPTRLVTPSWKELVTTYQHPPKPV